MENDEMIQKIIDLHRKNLGSEYDDESQEIDRDEMSDYTAEQLERALAMAQESYEN